MHIVICKSGDFYDFFGSNERVKKVAEALGCAWSRETPGLHASVSLGVSPGDAKDSLAKLTAAGYTYSFAGDRQ
jgi:hypothetical protein